SSTSRRVNRSAATTRHNRQDNHASSATATNATLTLAPGSRAGRIGVDGAAANASRNRTWPGRSKYEADSGPTWSRPGPRSKLDEAGWTEDVSMAKPPWTVTTKSAWRHGVFESRASLAPA